MENQERCRKMAEALQRRDAAGATAEEIADAGKEIQRLRTDESLATIADIHPAWMIDILSQESPRIVGVILRFLPSKHVRFILEHLPERIREGLPSLVESFAVPAPVLEMIRHRFCTHFVPMPNSAEITDWSLAQVPCLNMAQLHIFFHDLGVQEMATALSAIDADVLRALFHRLNIKEARALEQRLYTISDISAGFRRDARYSVLATAEGVSNSGEWLQEIGMQAFIKALTPDQAPVVVQLKLKLDPRTGYLLERYFWDLGAAGASAYAAERRLMIEKRLQSLFGPEKPAVGRGGESTWGNMVREPDAGGSNAGVGNPST